LCGPRLQDLPLEATSRSRLLEQAKFNRLEIVKMIESIISTKEEDEREDQANDGRRALRHVARVLTGALTEKLSQMITANRRRTLGPKGRNAGPKEERATNTPTLYLQPSEVMLGSMNTDSWPTGSHVGPRISKICQVIQSGSQIIK